MIAVQNNVEHKQLRAATSTTTFFRSIGGSFGTAVFGAVWTAQLATELSKNLPAEVAAQLNGLVKVRSPPSVASRISPGRSGTACCCRSRTLIDQTFLIAVPVMLVAFVLSFFLKEVPLKTKPSIEDEELAHDAGVPVPETVD